MFQPHPLTCLDRVFSIPGMPHKHIVYYLIYNSVLPCAVLGRAYSDGHQVDTGRRVVQWFLNITVTLNKCGELLVQPQRICRGIDAASPHGRSKPSRLSNLP